MAYDGLVTRAVARELQSLVLGKIEKVYQPDREVLVIHIHTRAGNVKLLASASGSSPRVHLTESSPVNPPEPFPFCMLMRKHLQGGRIVSVAQREAERILEIGLETQSELGFTLSRKLILEIMGKHSNLILVDTDSGKVIDAIKRISLDASRARQILPGKRYEYPPAQDKIGFDQVTREQVETALSAATGGDEAQRGKVLLRTIGGISPAISREMAMASDPFAYLEALISRIDDGMASPRLYRDADGAYRDFHVTALSDFSSCQEQAYDNLSHCLEDFFLHRDEANQVRQRERQLTKNVATMLDKHLLKLQRLQEDLARAQDSEDLRLYGELLTAAIHLVKPGEKQATVPNYYDGSQVTIPLNPKLSPSRNAQQYYKRYGKAKTAVKEKQIQITETENDIAYLRSVLTYLENTEDVKEVEALQQELVETGYLRRRKSNGREKKWKAQPYRHLTPSGKVILAGRNNRENDQLTLHTAAKTDLWLHTKDIPGSHVILQLEGSEPTEEDIFAAASVAAYYSKGRTSENVPVDYVKVRYVKKPAGSKPGMVIFTNNRTVWANPKLP